MDEKPQMTSEQLEKYHEIRAIHWTHRTPEQKAEYETLKPLVPERDLSFLNQRDRSNKKPKSPLLNILQNAQEAPKEVIVKQIPYVPPQTGEMVTMTKDGLMKMLEEIRNEERGRVSVLKDNDWQEYKLPTQRKYTATIKLWQKDYRSPKGLVVDWHRSRFANDPNTNEKTEFFDVTIRYDDGKEEVVEMPIIEFSRFNEIETVEILSIKEKKMQLKQGEVKASVIQTDDTGMTTIMDNKTSQTVPLLVVKDEPMAKVRRGNGQIMDISVSRLNQ